MKDKNKKIFLSLLSGLILISIFTPFCDSCFPSRSGIKIEEDTTKVSDNAGEDFEGEYSPKEDLEDLRRAARENPASKEWNESFGGYAELLMG